MRLFALPADLGQRLPLISVIQSGLVWFLAFGYQNWTVLDLQVNVNRFHHFLLLVLSRRFFVLQVDFRRRLLNQTLIVYIKRSRYFTSRRQIRCRAFQQLQSRSRRLRLHHRRQRVAPLLLQRSLELIRLTLIALLVLEPNNVQHDV